MGRDIREGGPRAPASQALAGAPGGRPMSICPPGLLDSSCPTRCLAVELPAPRPAPAGGGPTQARGGDRGSPTFSGDGSAQVTANPPLPRAVPTWTQEGARSHAPGVRPPSSARLSALGAAGSLPASTQMAVVAAPGRGCSEPVLAGSSRPRPVRTLGSPVAEGAALAFAGCVRAAQTQAAGGPPWRVVRAAAVAVWRPLNPAEAGRPLSPFLGAARSHFTCIQE